MAFDVGRAMRGLEEREPKSIEELKDRVYELRRATPKPARRTNATPKVTNFPFHNLLPSGERPRETQVRDQEAPGLLRHPLSAAVVGGFVGAVVGSILTYLLSNLPG